MINIAVVSLMYALIYLVDGFTPEHYYFACSASYAAVSAISAMLYIKYNNKLLLLYATVNLITSMCHFLIQIGFYNSLSYSLWYAPLNLSLITEVVEIMLLLKGITSIATYINNMLVSYNNQRKINLVCMDKIE